MRKIVLVVAMTTIMAACSPTAEEAPAEAAATEEATMEAATTAADGGPSTGTFRITNAEGEVATEVVAEDGTYTSTEADGEVETGTWEQRSPNEFCAKADDDDEMKCYTEVVGDDGVWTSTDPEDGGVSTVERVEAAAETMDEADAG